MSEINSVESRWLASMTDDEIRTETAKVRDQLLGRVFPGTPVKAESVLEALALTDADFSVAKRQLLVAHSPEGIHDHNVPITPYLCSVASVRTDTNQALGIIGKDHGLCQTWDELEALDILVKRGDAEIINVDVKDGGARIRVTAFLGVTEFMSADGAPNTLGHFAIFDVAHDGSASTTVAIYTLRMECLNGMTSREVVAIHKLRHTSRVGERLEGFTQAILATLIGEAQAETEMFKRMVHKRMTAAQFETFAVDFLGGALEEDASAKKLTRRQTQLDELLEYFGTGNQGAGATAWGAYQSVTRWIESKRERYEDAAKRAQKFDSNLSGDGQHKLARALRTLSR